MNTSGPDLGDLLRGAVDGIEPADRIDAIRARAAAAPTRAARPWLYAAGGVVLATAATVAGFAGVDSRPPSHDHGSMVAPVPVKTQLVAAYFVGRTDRGFRLFREFDEVPAGDPLQAALARIERPPSDPDYQTLWPHGSLVSASVKDGTIEVELGDNAPSTFAGPAEGLPEQQVVYTLQAAVGERLPVRLLRHGQPVGAPMTAEPQADVLSQVMVNDPTEGLAVHDSFTARGAANSFEANVPWEIRDGNGAVVMSGSATAEGWMDKLYPWETHIDVRNLPSGTYTFVASTDDPSGGEGPGPDSDTRTIIVG